MHPVEEVVGASVVTSVSALSSVVDVDGAVVAVVDVLAEASVVSLAAESSVVDGAVVVVVVVEVLAEASVSLAAESSVVEGAVVVAVAALAEASAAVESSVADEAVVGAAVVVAGAVVVVDVELPVDEVVVVVLELEAVEPRSLGMPDSTETPLKESTSCLPATISTALPSSDSVSWPKWNS